MKVIDYSNTIMYKIVPNELNLDLIYIGSTTNFRARKTTHKDGCMNPNSKKFNFKVYQMIRDNGGWSEWSMIEIEKYPCADSNECRKRERELMEQYNCNLNTRKPYITLEENKQYQCDWKANHKNETRKYFANYYNTNKEILNAKAKEKRLEKKITSLNLEN